MADDKAPEIDEVALNVLLAEGMDVPTAYAASIKDDDPKTPPQWLLAVCYIVAIVVGLLVFLAL